jgi:proteasome lid subunit RPN8/RPN11
MSPRSIIRDGGTCRLVEGGARAVGRSAATDDLPEFFPQLSPTYRATFGSSVRDSIEEEIRSINRSFDTAHETGGWLLADRRRPDHIVAATDPGDGALFAARSVQLDLSRARDLEAAHPHLALRGCYHLHPNGDPVPSETDRRAWARGARSVTGDFWIGLIATPASSMYGRPELHGWITTKAFCEPLRLES